VRVHEARPDDGSDVDGRPSDDPLEIKKRLGDTRDAERVSFYPVGRTTPGGLFPQGVLRTKSTEKLR
jgi:hypothetical protein